MQRRSFLKARRSRRSQAAPRGSRAPYFGAQDAPRSTGAWRPASRAAWTTLFGTGEIFVEVRVRGHRRASSISASSPAAKSSRPCR